MSPTVDTIEALSSTELLLGLAASIVGATLGLNPYVTGLTIGIFSPVLGACAYLGSLLRAQDTQERVTRVVWICVALLIPFKPVGFLMGPGWGVLIIGLTIVFAHYNTRSILLSVGIGMLLCMLQLVGGLNTGDIIIGILIVIGGVGDSSIEPRRLLSLDIAELPWFFLLHNYPHLVQKTSEANQIVFNEEIHAISPKSPSSFVLSQLIPYTPAFLLTWITPGLSAKLSGSIFNIPVLPVELVIEGWVLLHGDSGKAMIGELYKHWGATGGLAIPIFLSTIVTLLIFPSTISINRPRLLTSLNTILLYLQGFFFLGFWIIPFIFTRSLLLLFSRCIPNFIQADTLPLAILSPLMLYPFLRLFYS